MKKLKYIGFFITILSFIYLINVVVNLETNIFDLKSPIRALFLIFVFSIFYVILISITTFGWKFILDFLSDKRIGYIQVFQINAKSNIAKYLPGNILHFVGRNYLGRRLGLKHTDIALSSFLELIFIIVTAAIISFITLFEEFENFTLRFFSFFNYKIFVLVFSVLLIVIFVYFRVKEEKKKSTDKLKKIISKRFVLLIIKNCTINIFSFVSHGFILFLVFKYILEVNVSYSQLQLVISTYTFSWLVGYITPGSPAGIGIRESFLLIMLSSSFGKESTLMAALIIRLISIIGDIFLFIIGILVAYFFNRNMESEK